MQNLCNFSALQSVGVVSIENGQLVVENIDTTDADNGPVEIQEGCQISCTSECRVSANTAPQAPDAPEDLRSYAGPGFLKCTDGYCETEDATYCKNMVQFEGYVTDDDGKVIAWNPSGGETSIEIEAGCVVDCSESKCTFEDAPDVLTRFVGPGLIKCTNGYCETDVAGCNDLKGFPGIIITYANGTATASDIDSAAAPIEIKAECAVECSNKCTFEGFATISF